MPTIEIHGGAYAEWWFKLAFPLMAAYKHLTLLPVEKRLPVANT